MAEISKVDPIVQLKLDLLVSLELYTKVMFKAQYNRSFAISDHHRQLFDKLQQVVDGKIKRLIINMPPRYSKTEIVVKSLISWGFALNAACRFLHLSYSDVLVNDNSNTVKSIMMEPIYKQLFPDSALLKEKGSSTRWKTRAGGELYAVSTQGQVTGFGAGKVDDEEAVLTDWYSQGSDDKLEKLLGSIGAKQNVFDGAIIIDDPIKPEDALSDTIRERINQRFETTIRNRTNSRNTPIIIIMQRLHEHDLCGYLIEKEPDEWEVLSLPAIYQDENGEDKALWPLKHTVDELYKMRDLDTVVFDTQYMQDPKPKEGLLYENGLGTYGLGQIPKGSQIRRLNYTDTADTGADFLCSICFIDTPDFIYVTDVIYTDKAMEQTEPATADLLSANSTAISLIEGNNGGRGFARNVTSKLRSRNRNFKTRVETFTQTKNKYVRIFTKSADVQNLVLMPEGWDRKWPKFYNAITSYRKDNKRKSQHDDAVDALTGCVEMRQNRVYTAKIKQRN